jgi:diaminohydroxyphosphoribosylaminopyrimidine deaminase/5-amino-6-(5-phosphoribosylamino)uracil reductase
VGILESECKKINRRFITFHSKKRPYILLKWAETKDGYIDLERVSNQPRTINWISQPTTQTFTHQWRANEQAILVGWKTILYDNPSLTTRAYFGKSPIRIIIDPALKSPKESIVFSDELPLYILNLKKNDTSTNKKFIQLKDFAIQTILDALFKLNISSVIIEGGKYTLEQFISSNVWDEARIIIGNTTFEKGLVSPKLNQSPQREIKIEEDRILFYSNLETNSSPSNS